MARDCFEKLFSMEGKVSLITGGYKGIGLAIAEMYGEAGANLAIVARNLEGCREEAERLENTFGIKAMARSMDVRQPESVESVVKEISDEFGKIDILVNCAGIGSTAKPVSLMTDEDLGEVMNTNFRGTFLVSRAVAPIMVEQKKGKIINIASILGKIAFGTVTDYCASKAAVLQLTRTMALELIPDNIQVNAICPGFFLTDMTRSFLESEEGEVFIKTMIPINRVGDVGELKSLALYLANCPSFMTGSAIYIDGGQTIT